jgi:uncharacterized membrane protein YbhN (UPF0104 family)
LFLAAKLALAAGLLTWLLSTGQLDLGMLLTIPASVDLALFLGAVLISLMLPAVRWWCLLHSQQVHVPFIHALGLTWTGHLAGMFLPGGASGDVVKGCLIVRGRRQGRTRALSTILADRAIGLYCFLLLGSLAGLWLAIDGEASGPGRAMAGVAALFLAGLTSAAIALLLAPSRRFLFRVLPERVRLTLHEVCEVYARSKATLLGCFCLSLLNSAACLTALALAAGIFNGVVPWAASFLAGPLVILTNCLPITPGGLGVGETVSHSLYQLLSIPYGAEAMALFRLGTLVVALPGLFIVALAPAAPRHAAPGS